MALEDIVVNQPLDDTQRRALADTDFRLNYNGAATAAPAAPAVPAAPAPLGAATNPDGTTLSLEQMPPASAGAASTWSAARRNADIVAASGLPRAQRLLEFRQTYIALTLNSTVGTESARNAVFNIAVGDANSTAQQQALHDTDLLLQYANPAPAPAATPVAAGPAIDPPQPPYTGPAWTPRPAAGTQTQQPISSLANARLPSTINNRGNPRGRSFASPVDYALYQLRRGSANSNRAPAAAWLRGLGFSDSQIELLANRVAGHVTRTTESLIPAFAITLDNITLNENAPPAPVTPGNGALTEEMVGSFRSLIIGGYDYPELRTPALRAEIRAHPFMALLNADQQNAVVARAFREPEGNTTYTAATSVLYGWFPNARTNVTPPAGGSAPSPGRTERSNIDAVNAAEAERLAALTESERRAIAEAQNPELVRALEGLKRLGALMAARGQMRGVRPQRALGTRAAENATDAQKALHFHEAMRAGVAQLNAMGNGRYWTYQTNSGSGFDMYVNEDAAQVARAVAAGTRVPRGTYVAGGSGNGSINTTGFEQLPSYVVNGGAGAQFYDLYIGSGMSAGYNVYSSMGLTPANKTRMPINRLRAFLKWGRILGDWQRALEQINFQLGYYIGGNANAIVGATDLGMLNLIRNSARAAVNSNNPLVYNPANNTIAIDGVELSPAQLRARILATPTRSGTERRNSPDVVMLAALIDTLGQAGAQADAIIAAASQTGNPTLFKGGEASMMDTALDPLEGDAPVEDGVLFSRVEEPATTLPGVSDTDAVLTDATEEGADNIIGDSEQSSERLTAPELIYNLDNNVPAPPATVPRGMLQAMARGDWKAAREQFGRFGDFLNNHLHDHLTPLKRWIESLPVTERLKDTVLNALYTAPARRDEHLARALQEGGGQAMRRAIALAAKEAGMTVETAVQQIGYWLTAQRAPTGNAHLLTSDAAAVTRARLKLEEAQRAELEGQQAGLPPGELAELQVAVREATGALATAARQLQERTAAVLNPAINVRFHTGGGVAGFNNAQARHIAAAVEGRIRPELLQEVAKHAYDLNAWRLSLDVESGKGNPAIVAAFLRDPSLEPLLQSLKDAADRVDASNPASVATLDSLRAEVREKVRSNYVPLTGNPDTALDEELFTSGTRQPNVTRDYRLRGRTSSIPDDAITATWAQVLKSASYSAWAPFQDGVRELYNSLSPEQREHYGMFRDTIDSDSNGPMANAVIRRRGNKAYAYSFRDPKMLEALRGANVESNSVTLAPLTWATQKFAYAATQLNIFFAPKNFVRDAWERSELMRTREYRKPDGTVIDSSKAAGKMLAHLMNPEMMKATGREAFALEKNSVHGNYLKEMLENGGGSLFSDRFNASRVQLIKSIEAETSITGAKDRALRFTVDAYNKTFELAPALAAHMALRDMGLSPSDAAAASLDLMNFRKRGESMALPRALYAFAQPAITGGANAISALYNPRTGKVNPRGWIRLASYTLAFTAAQAFFRSLADEDEGGNLLDQQSDLVKNSHLLIPIGNGFLKLPLAFGLTRVANGAARAILGAGTGELTPGEALGGWAKGSVVPVFSPLEANEIDWTARPVQAWLTTFMPTFIKPVLSVGLNLTPWGTKVVFDNFEDTTEFRSEQFGKRIAPEYQGIARFMRSFGFDLAPEEVRTLIRGYPLGPATLGWNVLVENEFAKSQGREAISPFVAQVYTNFSPSARYFQFRGALDATDALQRRQNAGGDAFTAQENLQLAWREDWNDQEREFRNRMAAVTRNKTMSDKQKAGEKASIQNEREQAQILALYRYRQALGRSAKRLEIPRELMP